MRQVPSTPGNQWTFAGCQFCWYAAAVAISHSPDLGKILLGTVVIILEHFSQVWMEVEGGQGFKASLGYVRSCLRAKMEMEGKERLP